MLVCAPRLRRDLNHRHSKGPCLGRFGLRPSGLVRPVLLWESGSASRYCCQASAAQLPKRSTCSCLALCIDARWSHQHRLCDNDNFGSLDDGFSSLALQRLGKSTFVRPRWMPEDNSMIDLRI